MMDDATIDAMLAGALDAVLGKPKASDAPEYLSGYAAGLTARHAIPVLPDRPEGYYHSPIGTFD